MDGTMTIILVGGMVGSMRPEDWPPSESNR
jgi:hypothetical protein